MSSNSWGYDRILSHNNSIFPRVNTSGRNVIEEGSDWSIDGEELAAGNIDLRVGSQCGRRGPTLLRIVKSIPSDVTCDIQVRELEAPMDVQRLDILRGRKCVTPVDAHLKLERWLPRAARGALRDHHPLKRRVLHRFLVVVHVRRINEHVDPTVRWSGISTPIDPFVDHEIVMIHARHEHWVRSWVASPVVARCGSCTG